MSFVQITQTNNQFVDIDISFIMHPVTRDVAEKVNANAIIASIKNLVTTKMYERPFHPELSCQVNDLLFEPLIGGVAAAMKRSILYVINNYEPRADVQLIDVQETPDNNSIQVTILFSIVGTTNTVQATFTLERTI